jgi:hypothetical protein
MQNEPNLVRRMRITSAVMTRRYGNTAILSATKNEPKRTQTYTVWAIWAISSAPGGFYVSFTTYAAIVKI